MRSNKTRQSHFNSTWNWIIGCYAPTSSTTFIPPIAFIGFDVSTFQRNAPFVYSLGHVKLLGNTSRPINLHHAFKWWFIAARTLTSRYLCLFLCGQLWEKLQFWPPPANHDVCNKKYRAKERNISTTGIPQTEICYGKSLLGIFC